MFKGLKSSFHEIKSVKNLCALSFLLVLKVLISSFRIVITPGVQISFGFVVYIVVGAFFGFFASFLFCLISYFLSLIFGYSLFFHIGFLVSSVVSATIYALFLYKLKLKVKRVVLATVVNDFIVHFFLNIFWLSQIFNGGNFLVAFSQRFLKSVIMLFLNCFISAFIVILLKKITKLNILK